jgi:hypothetical protein
MLPSWQHTLMRKVGRRFESTLDGFVIVPASLTSVFASAVCQECSVRNTEAAYRITAIALRLLFVISLLRDSILFAIAYEQTMRDPAELGYKVGHVSKLSNATSIRRTVKDGDFLSRTGIKQEIGGQLCHCFEQLKLSLIRLGLINGKKIPDTMLRSGTR